MLTSSKAAGAFNLKKKRVEGVSYRRVAREAGRIKDVHVVALLVVVHAAAVYLISAPARLPAPSRTMLLRLPGSRPCGVDTSFLSGNRVPGRVAAPHERREQKQIAQRASHGGSVAPPPLERRERPPSFVAS